MDAKQTAADIDRMFELCEPGDIIERMIVDCRDFYRGRNKHFALVCCKNPRLGLLTVAPIDRKTFRAMALGAVKLRKVRIGKELIEQVHKLCDEPVPIPCDSAELAELLAYSNQTENRTITSMDGVERVVPINPELQNVLAAARARISRE
ncbi:MAG TPA: hypothetical protein VGB97_01550 [Candidatus Paceibacterota bacterium]